MTAKIGWDQLLKIRSKVFVMEDEYRTEKQEAIHSNRNPSTDGLRGTPDPTANGDDAESEGDEGDEEGEEGEKSEKDEGGDEKPAETESTAETLAANGDAPSGVEKPSNTIDPGEIKTDTENVGPPISSLIPSVLTFNRASKMMTICLDSTPNDFVSDGSTAFSWCSTKTSACTPSGAPRWHSIAHNKCSTANRLRNGRSWVP